jgi:hypothetical protein
MQLSGISGPGRDDAKPRSCHELLLLKVADASFSSLHLDPGHSEKHRCWDLGYTDPISQFFQPQLARLTEKRNIHICRLLCTVRAKSNAPGMIGRSCSECSVLQFPQPRMWPVLQHSGTPPRTSVGLCACLVDLLATSNLWLKRNFRSKPFLLDASRGPAEPPDPHFPHGAQRRHPNLSGLCLACRVYNGPAKSERCILPLLTWKQLWRSGLFPSFRIGCPEPRGDRSQPHGPVWPRIDSLPTRRNDPPVARCPLPGARLSRRSHGVTWISHQASRLCVCMRDGEATREKISGTSHDASIALCRRHVEDATG